MPDDEDEGFIDDGDVDGDGAGADGSKEKMVQRKPTVIVGPFLAGGGPTPELLLACSVIMFDGVAQSSLADTEMGVRSLSGDDGFGFDVAHPAAGSGLADRLGGGGGAAAAFGTPAFGASASGKAPVAASSADVALPAAPLLDSDDEGDAAASVAGSQDDWLVDDVKARHGLSKRRPACRPPCRPPCRPAARTCLPPCLPERHHACHCDASCPAESLPALT